MPAGDTAPEIWLLGSSDYSGALAALLGLRFAFAHFISAHGGDAVMQAYKRSIMPSAREAAPHALLCVFAICAETGAEAERLAESIDLRRLHMALGVDAPVPTYAEAAARSTTSARPPTSARSARGWCSAIRPPCAPGCSSWRSGTSPTS